MAARTVVVLARAEHAYELLDDRAVAQEADRGVRRCAACVLGDREVPRGERGYLRQMGDREDLTSAGERAQLLTNRPCGMPTIKDASWKPPLNPPRPKPLEPFRATMSARSCGGSRIATTSRCWSSRRVGCGRGIVAHLVADGGRNSHEWTPQKAQLLKAFDEAGITTCFMDPQQGGFIEGPIRRSAGRRTALCRPRAVG